MYVYVTLASYFGVIIPPPPENGLLASRIEILTRHQSETLKKMGESALFILLCTIIKFYTLWHTSLSV